MAERREYEMTEEDLTKIKEAGRPVPYLVVGGIPPTSPQVNANRAWEALGARMGFKHMTVQPAPGRADQRFFTAEPVVEGPGHRAVKYPEHEKMAKVKEDSHRLGEFIDWMEGKGYLIAEWGEGDRRHSEDLYPVHKTINQWLADFYGVDLTKIEEEKQQMLDEIRQANDTTRAIDEAARTNA